MNRFWERLKSSFFMQTVFCLVSVAVIIGVYFLGVNRILYDKFLNQSISIDTKVTQEISECSFIKDQIVLSGWIVRQDSINEDIKVVLKSTSDEGAYLLNTNQSKSDIVSDYFDVDWNYGNTNFIAEVEKKKLNSEVCYEIFLVLEYSIPEEKKEHRVKVETGRFLYNDKVYSYNPLEFVEPVFRDKELNIVVTDGELCLFAAEEEMYIYEYNDSFYWIVGENSRFNVLEDVYVLYHVGSSKYKELNKHMQIYGCDAYNFNFVDKEITFEENEMYRVAVCDVPSGYPKTYYYTAFCEKENGNIWWSGYFYPSYNLNGESK